MLARLADRSQLHSLLLSAVLFLAALPPPASAAITTTGDVEPANPATWTMSTTAYIGDHADGTLTVDGGSALASYAGYLGYSSAATGTVTIDGAGSTWTISDGGLSVGGYPGYGTLNITNGGAVSVVFDTELGGYPGSAGTINFGANGGTLTTGSFCASPTQVTGTGTVNASGLVSDVNLLFNSTASLKQTIRWNGLPNQNVAINLDASTATTGMLGAGWIGTGSLTIQNGVAVTSGVGYLGYNSGSVGTATVNGPSTWSDYGNFYVGYSGSGALKINNNGKLNIATGTNPFGGLVYYGYIGYNSGSVGTATVDGAGSTWTDSSSLYVGYSGTGTLKISNGGAVNSTFYTSYLACDGYVGYNSGASGTVIVDGNASKWTNDDDAYVGYWGNGCFQITNGGTVSGGGFIGYNSGSVGTATVDGSGSTWTSSGIVEVGFYGKATLTITNGGTVTSKYGYICEGSGASGTVTVDGVGSTWTTGTGALFVGSSGSGTLKISNGGTVTSGVGYLGSNPGVSGTVIVDGGGSKWTSAGAYVGYWGNGELQDHQWRHGQRRRLHRLQLRRFGHGHRRRRRLDVERRRQRRVVWQRDAEGHQRGHAHQQLQRRNRLQLRRFGHGYP